MAVSIGDAVLKLGVDTKDLDKGMAGLKGKLQKHSKAIGIGMTAMGGAILAAGALSIKTFAAMGDEVAKMAIRTGFSTEALSELRHAAEISGADLSTLEKGVKRMSGTILDAQDGLETYIRAFQHIGIEVEELDKLNPEEQFLKIAEAIAEVEDPTKRAAIAQDIFGRAGTALLPLFAAGKEGLKDLREEAHKLGIVFDQEAANKAAEFNDAMTRLKQSVSGVKMVIAEQLIPALMPVIDKVKEIISGISTWMKEHPGLTRVITLTTGAIGLLLVALGPLLIFLPQITAAFTIMKGIMLTKLIPTIVAMTSALWAKVAALYAAMVAMGPAGWAMAAISMGIIATGLVVIIKKAKEATSAFTGKVEKYTPAAREADDATRQWNESLTKLEAVTRKITEAEDKLVKVEEKLTEQTRGVAHVTSFLIGEGKSLADVLEREMLKTEGLSQAYEDFVDIILAMEDPSDRHIQYLRDYIELKEEATGVEKEHQKELEETTKLLEEQADAQKEATKRVEDAIRALRYERSEAGRLNISIDDIISALHLMGRSNEYITDTLVSLGDESSNVLKVMKAFGLTALQVAEAIGMEADEIDRLKTTLEGLREEQEAPLVETPEYKKALKEYKEIAEAGGYLWGKSPEWLAAKAAESEAVARWAAAEPGTPEQAAAWAAIKVAAHEAILAERATIAALGGIPRLYEDINKATREAIEYWRGVEPAVPPIEPPPEWAEPWYAQHGGIAMNPVAAVIAERKPEAVIPLDRLEGMIGGRRVNIYVELNGRVIAKAIGQPLVDDIRLRTGVHI